MRLTTLRVLLTGASGCFGSARLDQLKNQACYQVIILARDIERYSTIQEPEILNFEDTNTTHLRRLKFDAIAHLASGVRSKDLGAITDSRALDTRLLSLGKKADILRFRYI